MALWQPMAANGSQWLPSLQAGPRSRLTVQAVRSEDRARAIACEDMLAQAP